MTMKCTVTGSYYGENAINAAPQKCFEIDKWMDR